MGYANKHREPYSASGVKSMWKGLLRTAVLLQHSHIF
jgi:hypothetical protein